MPLMFQFTRRLRAKDDAPTQVGRKSYDYHNEIAASAIARARASVDSANIELQLDRLDIADEAVG